MAHFGLGHYTRLWVDSYFIAIVGAAYRHIFSRRLFVFSHYLLGVCCVLLMHARRPLKLLL